MWTVSGKIRNFALGNMAKVKRKYDLFAKKWRGNVITMLLTMLFASYYSGSTLFIHTHFLGFGQGMVTHSHPFLPGAHHAHSGNDFEALALLNDIATEEIQPIYVPANEEILLTLLYSQPVNRRAAAEHLTVGPRAPPACFI